MPPPTSASNFGRKCSRPRGTRSGGCGLDGLRGQDSPECGGAGLSGHHALQRRLAFGDVPCPAPHRLWDTGQTMGHGTNDVMAAMRLLAKAWGKRGQVRISPGPRAWCPSHHSRVLRIDHPSDLLSRFPVARSERPLRTAKHTENFLSHARGTVSGRHPNPFTGADLSAVIRSPHRRDHESVRHGETKRPGRLEIDHQLELGRPQDRQVGGLFALEDAADVIVSQQHARTGH